MSLIKYLITGVFNTIIGLGVTYLLMYALQFDLVNANAGGYFVGILFSFVVNRKWTFRNQDHIAKTFLRFLFVLAIAYSANLYAVLYVNSHFHLNPYIEQLFGIFPYTLIGYLGNNFYTFAAKSNTDLPVSKTPAYKKTVITRAIDISLVIPCYNEEEVLGETSRQLIPLLEQLIDENKITAASRIYYIDDGSKDNTWQIIENQAKDHACIHGIKLSRNRGHQNALLSGLMTAEGEVVISLDADLQDDLSAIKKMIEHYLTGDDIVYGVRDSRKSDTFFKSFTARAYYFLLESMGVEIIYNHADYRLMSRQAIDALREYSEVNLFLRGIIPQLGFSYSLVYYDRAERFAGESKYPLRKMLDLAWQGITSFSEVPLRLITGMGLVVSFFSFFVTLWAFYIRFFTSDALPGWTSTVLPIYFLGGVQLLCLGIMGEYLAKIYYETKRRPRYIIEKII